MGDAPAGEPPSAAEVNLWRAAEDNHIEPLWLFFREGGQLQDLANDYKQTLLHCAAMSGSDDALAFLLRTPRVGKLVNTRDVFRRTALHLASGMGYGSCVARLVEVGASLEVQDEDGATPLHLACKFQWKEPVNALLMAGADPLKTDKDGQTALGVAAGAQDKELAALMADYSSRPRPWTLWHLRRCILPQWTSASCRGAQAVEGGSATSRGVELDLRAADDPQHLFASEGVRGEVGGECPAAASSPRYACGEAKAPLSPLAAVLDEARRRERYLEQGGQGCPLGGGEGADCEIEWHGLEPVLVERRQAPHFPGAAAACKPGKLSAEATDDFSTATASPSNLSGRLSHDTPPGHWEVAAAGRAGLPVPPQAPPAGADRRGLAPLAGAASWAGTSHTAAALGAPAALRPEGAPPQEPKEFAIFRRHAFFDESVARLQFEVEWTGAQPLVSSVRPDGEAHSRGLLPGDRLVEIGGEGTCGRGRSELLPLLKLRPLMVKFDREEQVLDLEEPHVELRVLLPGRQGGGPSEGLGFELAKRGHLPTVLEVQEDCLAWCAGVRDGDGVLEVNGVSTLTLSKGAMTAALAQQTELTIWRRPMGMNLEELWVASVHSDREY